MARPSIMQPPGSVRSNGEPFNFRRHAPNSARYPRGLPPTDPINAAKGDMETYRPPAKPDPQPMKNPKGGR